MTNLRVYDADLPNFNVAIDVYGDKIHVQEYAPPKQIPADVAKLALILFCKLLEKYLAYLVKPFYQDACQAVG